MRASGVPDDTIRVPDFRGMQALNAWLTGHDLGLLLQGPDPDGPDPLLHGVVVAQVPPPGTVMTRWAIVTVWVRHDPGDDTGVREPRAPGPPTGALERELPEPG